MKFTLSWLKDHLETEASLQEIVDAMTMAGLEVEEVIDPAAALAPFTIAHVKSAEQHPDADRLRVCQVETVDGEKQIVCGASNARAGIAVAYAPLGTYIPGLDFALDKKPRKIRGVESSGMMCSGKELELGDDHDGILELDPAKHPVGQPVADAFGQTDPVIDFEVTPNRPDWLGVRGIARDLAAAGLGTLKPDTIEPVPAAFKNEQTVRIETDGCAAFVGRVVRGVKNGPSPDWLQDKLKAIGLRPISALVDITNYLTFDRARPLHVYDLAKVTGDIIVRMGRDEAFAALDDKSYTATEDDIVIADEAGALGLGGIVGGESSGVSETTTDILIECAVFDPLTIRRSAKRLGVNSDAKYRFERGIDTGFMQDGMELATRLILDLCGGEASDVVIAGEIPAAPEPVTFDPARVEQLLGFAPDKVEIEAILAAQGFERQGQRQSTPWTMHVPTWRRDVTMQADLVEDVARIAGFDRLPATSLPALPGRREPTATLTQTRTRLARRALAQRGLSEAITWSFVLQDHAKAFGGGDDALVLDNPISSDLNTMRPSALIHLLLAGQRSADRGYPGAALFELGPVYRGLKPDDQSLCLAGLRRVEPGRDWAGEETITALSAKADALAALSAMGAKTDNLQLADAKGEYWHPGRSARLQMGPKNALAEFGELHPRVLKALGISGRVVAFEVWPDAIPAPRKKSASKSKGALTLSDLMPVHRDFAFIVPDTVGAGTLSQAIARADKSLITDVTLFDVYAGKGIEDGQKSLAFDVTLSPKDATLTDQDLESVSAKIVKAAEKLGASLRG